MDKIRTAIIGMGRMGKMRLEGMTNHGGFEIVGISDVNPDNLKDYNIPSFSDYKECIDSVNPDAVVVCTYNAFIPDIVCYSLSKNKHVFSEKPPGKCLDDVLKMKSVYEKHTSCILKFGFNHRYHYSIIEAKNIIDSGLLGDIVCARGIYGKAGNPNFQKEWRNNKTLSGGGILIDQGIHMLDLLYYFMGFFSDIKSYSDNLLWDGIDGDDSTFVIMKNDRGQVASLHSSALQWKHKFNLEIICTDGYISLKGLKTSTSSYGKESVSYYKKDLEGIEGRLGRPLEHTMLFDTDCSWSYEYEEFYDAIRGKRPIINGTIHDAEMVMSMIETIYDKK